MAMSDDERVAYQVAGRLLAMENTLWWTRFGVFSAIQGVLLAGSAVLVSDLKGADWVRMAAIVVLSVVGIWLFITFNALLNRAEQYHKHWLDTLRSLEAKFDKPDVTVITSININDPDKEIVSIKQRSRHLVDAILVAHIVFGAIAVVVALLG